MKDSTTYLEYDLELEGAIKKIKDSGAKSVCIQLPDGLKTKSQEIYDTLERETDATIFIWMGSNFGACDLPDLKVDLLIAWGHERYIL